MLIFNDNYKIYEKISKHSLPLIITIKFCSGKMDDY
jgi:hypothetical protein